MSSKAAKKLDTEVHSDTPYWAHRAMAEELSKRGCCAVIRKNKGPKIATDCPNRPGLCITEFCAVCYAKWWMAHTKAREALTHPTHPAKGME